MLQYFLYLTQIRFSKNEITEIQQRLQVLSTNLDEENSIYDFLLSFGLSKTTITRLKKKKITTFIKNEVELFYKAKFSLKAHFDSVYSTH